MAAAAAGSAAAHGPATAAQGDTFQQRWKDAERRYQVLDLRGYADQMAALAPEAASLTVPEHSYFFLSAARSACLTGDPTYRSFADTGLAGLSGSGDAPVSGTSLAFLREVLSAYAAGSASIVYPTPGPGIGQRDARGWAGSIVSVFGTRRVGRQRGGGSVQTLDLQATNFGDFEDQGEGAGEDYLALELTYCAGTRGQPHIALPDLPLRMSGRTRVHAQAFGLRPSTRVRVTWRHRPRGGNRASGCKVRSRPLGRSGARRDVVAVSGQRFSFRAPRQPAAGI